MPFKARNNPLSVPALLPLHPLPALPAPSRPLWAKAKLTLVRSLLHLSRIIHIFNIWNERRNREKRSRVGLGTDELELSDNGKLRSSEIRECCQGTLKEGQTTQNPTKHPKEGKKAKGQGQERHPLKRSQQQPVLRIVSAGKHQGKEEWCKQESSSHQRGLLSAGRRGRRGDRRKHISKKERRVNKRQI